MYPGRYSTKIERKQPAGKPKCFSINSNSDSEMAATSSTTLEERNPGGSSGARRIPITHLLNFEVANSDPVRFIGTSPSRKGKNSYESMGYLNRRMAFTKQRYIHSSFRFITLAAPEHIPSDPDQPISWDLVEAIVCPYSPTNLPTCPICLESPMVAPKMTCCGHVFCWTCLLRYFSDPYFSSSPGSFKWRNCPICFESTHIKDLRSVIFEPLLQDFSYESCVFEFVLLKKVSGLSELMIDESISDKFTKVLVKDVKWLVDSVIEVERASLVFSMAEDINLSQAEIALTLCEDRKNLLLSHSESLPIAKKRNACDPLCLYFHQSVDGQLVYLHPLTIKILKAHYGSYANFPITLSAPLFEIEWLIMTSDVRKRYKQLAHLPLGSHFALVELDLAQLVSHNAIAFFSSELEARREQRIIRKHEQLKSENDANHQKSSFHKITDFYGYTPQLVEELESSDLKDRNQFPSLVDPQSEVVIERPAWSPPSATLSPSAKSFHLMGGSLPYSRKR